MRAKGVFFSWLLILFSTAIFGQSLKLMTYNIRLDVAVDGQNNWTHRKDFLTSQIRFYEPDVLGVQEARPNQVVDMDRALLAYNHVGIAREGEGKGEASSIFYKKDRLALIETNTFWLSQTPGEISKGWDAAYNRVCTYALFEDKKTGQKF
jgi:endonuclease/exonuclease/phosphatase family metal-dependent hydrolase